MLFVEFLWFVRKVHRSDAANDLQKLFTEKSVAWDAIRHDRTLWSRLFENNFLGLEKDNELKVHLAFEFERLRRESEEKEEFRNKEIDSKTSKSHWKHVAGHASQKEKSRFTRKIPHSKLQTLQNDNESSQSSNEESEDE